MAPTYGLLLPQVPIATLHLETTEGWQARISSDSRPTALAMCWVEQKNVEGQFTERFLVGVVLDGHHKLLAATRLH